MNPKIHEKALVLVRQRKVQTYAEACSVLAKRKHNKPKPILRHSSRSWLQEHEERHDSFASD